MLINITSRSQKPENIYIYYENPITLDGDYEIALVSLAMWNSWYNISKDFNNNKIKYSDGREWKYVIIPDGNYTIRELNYFLKHHFKKDVIPIILEVNLATSRIILKLENNYKIDFTEGEVNEILGFDSGIYSKTQEAQKTANISRGINSISIHCSIIEGSYSDGLPTDVIYSFSPTTRPGAMIIKEPNHPLYLPLNVSIIREIRMKVTDQLNRIVSLNDEAVSYTLHLRPRRKKLE